MRVIFSHSQKPAGGAAAAGKRKRNYLKIMLHLKISQINCKHNTMVIFKFYYYECELGGAQVH